MTEAYWNLAELLKNEGFPIEAFIWAPLDGHNEYEVYADGFLMQTDDQKEKGNTTVKFSRDLRIGNNLIKDGSTQGK